VAAKLTALSPSLFSSRPSRLRIWFSKPEVWPIAVCISGACGWTAYMGSRYLMHSPNVTSIDRTERSHVIKDNEARGAAWRAASAHNVAKDPSKIRIWRK
jgi:hypothetical protein